MNDSHSDEQLRRALGAQPEIPAPPSSDAVFVAAVRRKLDQHDEAPGGIMGWRWALLTSGVLAAVLTVFTLSDAPKGTADAPAPASHVENPLFSQAEDALAEANPLVAFSDDEHFNLEALFSEVQSSGENDDMLGEGALAALEPELLANDDHDLLGDLKDDDLSAFEAILDEKLHL